MVNGPETDWHNLLYGELISANVYTWQMTSRMIPLVILELTLESCCRDKRKNALELDAPTV